MKRLLLLAVLGALLLSGIGVMGAYFTAQSQVPDNMIKAGEVLVSTEPTAAALNVDALAPGTTVTKSLNVVNDGSLASSIIVTGAKKAGITDFYEALTVRVTAEGELLYEGQLSALKTAPVVLAPGARTQLQFAVGLPASVGNELADDYVKLSLYVDAEQAH